MWARTPIANHVLHPRSTSTQQDTWPLALGINHLRTHRGAGSTLCKSVVGNRNLAVRWPENGRDSSRALRMTGAEISLICVHLLHKWADLLGQPLRKKTRKQPVYLAKCNQKLSTCKLHRRFTSSTINMAQTVITTKHSRKHQSSARKQVAIMMASLYSSRSARTLFLSAKF